MNCISGSIILICLLASSACGAPVSGPETARSPDQYAVHYTITPFPADGAIAVQLQLRQDNAQLRELAFNFSVDKVADIRADGPLDIDGNTAVWRPGKTGGNLRWVATVSEERRQNGYDALLTDAWGIFRAEDIIPSARTRTRRGAVSLTTMQFVLPPDWSAITEHAIVNDRIAVSKPHRRFDQPSGWIAIGELGVRRETIAGTRVAIAAPQGASVRRMDMLALLNWTLPELTAVLPQPVSRLTVVSAGDPMWRGGLSAPASIFIHADRPLISENATSTLLHEVVHVAFDINAANGFDWIVEGLAEYYSLELLQRGGAITTRRYQRALEAQATWAKQAKRLCQASSSGETTALAVGIFRQLNEEIVLQSNGSLNLDALVARLNSANADVNHTILRDAANEILDRPSTVLNLDNLPGCIDFNSGTT